MAMTFSELINKYVATAWTTLGLSVNDVWERRRVAKHISDYSAYIITVKRETCE